MLSSTALLAILRLADVLTFADGSAADVALGRGSSSIGSSGSSLGSSKGGAAVGLGRVVAGLFAPSYSVSVAPADAAGGGGGKLGKGGKGGRSRVGRSGFVPLHTLARVLPLSLSYLLYMVRMQGGGMLVRSQPRYSASVTPAAAGGGAAGAAGAAGGKGRKGGRSRGRHSAFVPLHTLSRVLPLSLSHLLYMVRMSLGVALSCSHISSIPFLPGFESTQELPGSYLLYHMVRIVVPLSLSYLLYMVRASVHGPSYGMVAWCIIWHGAWCVVRGAWCVVHGWLLLLALSYLLYM
ncbi:unnamed protein product, partial [Closterium sp. NIES-54]